MTKIFLQYVKLTDEPSFIIKFKKKCANMQQARG